MSAYDAATDIHQLCALCLRSPPSEGEFCTRCYRDLIAGFHRRHEAEQRLMRLEDVA